MVGCTATATASTAAAAVAAVAAATVSWPVTGDGYAVDITIMECVRLPLCLSLYAQTVRASVLLSIPVSYNQPISPSFSLYYDVTLPERVPRLKQCCCVMRTPSSFSSSSLRFTSDPRADLFGII